LWDELMKKESGYLLKMNPPLRPKESQEKILDLLVAGEIDWIETDHAPHLKKEKKQASGIPVLPFYPHFLREIKKMGISDSDLNALTHDNIVRTFHINIPNTKRTPDYSLQSEYEFDPFIFLQ
jgi:dihydroorotase